jgi:hypothetical protein
MARCTAPRQGHRTASARAACPACGGYSSYRSIHRHHTHHMAVMAVALVGEDGVAEEVQTGPQSLAGLVLAPQSCTRLLRGKDSYTIS